MTEHVGLLDMTAFAKFEVSGPGAAAWLNGLLTNAVPKTVGRLSLSYLLTLNGGVRAEFTVLREAPQRFYLVSAGALERHDYDYLQKALPTDGSVRLEKVTTQYGVFVVAGPRSRDLLSKLTRADLSNAAFPWLTAKTIDIGAAHAKRPARQLRRRTRLGTAPPDRDADYIFDKLFEAGAEFDLKPFGIRAMDSLRLEKSYKLIPRELSIEYAAFESGLDRFVSLKKPTFVGKDALLAWKRARLRQCRRDPGSPRRDRRRRAGVGADLLERGVGRTDDVGRIWLAGGQVAGAGDGAAGSGGGGDGAGDHDTRRDACGDCNRGLAVRPG